MPNVARVLTPLVLFLASSAHADGSFSGRDRFDLDRPEIRQFVETVAAEQKVQPLDVYRLLAKAEPQPKIIELISKPAEKVSTPMIATTYSGATPVSLRAFSRRLRCSTRKRAPSSMRCSVMKRARYSYQGATFSAGLLISSMIFGCGSALARRR